jgi:DNA-binding NarL/FixJ family response regulator
MDVQTSALPTRAKLAVRKLRILLADDHQVVRESIKLLINAQPDMEVAGEAGDGLEAIERAQLLLPDVVVMDVLLPGATGFEATEKLNETCLQVKVLALTHHKAKDYLNELMNAGAYGYVLKQSPAAELLRAIRVVAKGDQYLDPAMSGRVIGRQSLIGPREEEILRLLARGYSNKETAADLGISVKTVEAHRANAMRKLDLQGRQGIVRFALTQGWLREE